MKKQKPSSMRHRFRFFGQPTSAAVWSISSDDLLHIKKVLKLNSGTEVEVCDGEGRFAIGELTIEQTDTAVINCKEFTEPSPEPVILLLGALKHGDFDDLIGPLTEVGVTACKLFWQEGADKSRLSPKAQERWTKLGRAALKQAKSAYTMTIETYSSLELAISDLPDDIAEKYWMDPDGPSLLDQPRKRGGVALVVGGERGLDHKEQDLLRASRFLPAALGPHILRAKTAAVLAGGLGALRVFNSN